MARVDRVEPAACHDDPAVGPLGLEVLEGDDGRTEIIHPAMVAGLATRGL